MFTPTDADYSLIIFGIDKRRRPHASSFARVDYSRALKAAALMGYSAVRVGDEPTRALAARLPQGRVFASGRGFVPFCSRNLFVELKKAATAPAKAADSFGGRSAT